MTFKECLILGLVIITVVHSDKCYNTKCKTGKNTYVNCDPRSYRCREYGVGINGSCTYIGFESPGGSEYCFKGQTCVVDSNTGQASCEGEAEDDPFDFDYTPIVYGITAASVLAITLGFLYFYCYKRSNALRFGNQRVLAAQPVTYNTAVPPTTAHPPGTENIPSTTQYPPPQYPPPAQYPPAPGGYPPPAGDTMSIHMHYSDRILSFKQTTRSQY